jgi:hypothetical protein
MHSFPCGTGENNPVLIIEIPHIFFVVGYDRVVHVISILRQVTLGQVDVVLIYYAHLTYVLCPFD